MCNLIILITIVVIGLIAIYYTSNTFETYKEICGERCVKLPKDLDHPGPSFKFTPNNLSDIGPDFKVGPCDKFGYTYGALTSPYLYDFPPLVDYDNRLPALDYLPASIEC